MRGKFIAILSVSGVIFAVGVVGTEWYVRQMPSHRLWAWLGRSSFNEDDRLKVYNRRFYEQHPEQFREWPIPIEFFESDQPSPVYLFKPNLRMRWVKTWRGCCTLVPAHPGETAFWETNSWGFRGPEFPAAKPKGLIRIVCLGASTTTALHLRWEESYPYFLERELRRLVSKQSIQVINAGYVGLDVGNSFAILKQRVLPLQPDIIIFYEANNSINGPEFTPGLPCRVAIPVGLSGDCWLDATSSWYRWLYGHSATFALTSEEFGWGRRPPPPRPHPFDETLPKPSAVAFKETLRQMVQETKQHGSFMVLSSFITLAHQSLAVSYEQKPVLFHHLYKDLYPLTLEEVEHIYDYFNRQAADVARDSGIPFVDAAAEFPRDPRYFDFDSIHLNAQGNQALAKIFAKHLATEVFPKLHEH